jgi:hypothetical protein
MSRNVSPLRRAASVPLWARWVLALLLFAGIGVGFVAALRSGGGSSAGDAGAVALNREGQALVARDQAPHTARLRAGFAPRRALERAILTDMRVRARRGQVQGPVTSVRCEATAVARSGRRAFSCSAAAARVRYPFLGAVDPGARSVTWCKRDPPPVANDALDVPVSSRCLA